MRKILLAAALLFALTACAAPKEPESPAPIPTPPPVAAATPTPAPEQGEIPVYPDPITGFFESLHFPGEDTAPAIAMRVGMEAQAWRVEVEYIYATLRENASPALKSEEWELDLEKLEENFLRFVSAQANAEAYLAYTDAFGNEAGGYGAHINRGTGFNGGEWSRQAALMEWHAKSWYELFSQPNDVPTLEYYQFNPQETLDYLDTYTVEEYTVEPEWLAWPEAPGNPIDAWTREYLGQSATNTELTGDAILETEIWKAELLYTYDCLIELATPNVEEPRKALEGARDALLTFAPELGRCVALYKYSEAFRPKSWQDNPDMLHPGMLWRPESAGVPGNCYRMVTLRLRALLDDRLGEAPPWLFDPADYAGRLTGEAVTETFTISEYGETVTVTVRNGPKGGEDVVTVERDGEVLQTLTEESENGNQWRPQLTVEDLDFDGNLDFRYRTVALAAGTDLNHCYRWNGEIGQFEKIEALDGLPGLSFHPETETVQTYDRDTCMERYIVLRWTRDGLAYLRKAEWARNSTRGMDDIRADCRVWDHDPAAMPLDDSDGAWTMTANWVAPYDEVFTQLPPWLDPSYYGENVKTPSYIPTDLLDCLTPLLEQGEGYEPIENCGAFLDRYAVPHKAGNAIEIFDEKVWCEGWEGGVLAGVSGYMADLDNDGIEDAVLLSCQGTGHFTTLYFLRGLPDGDYEDTFAVHFNRGDWDWCISWKGTRYLVSSAEDRDGSRRFTGYNLYLLKDGAVRDRVFLSADQVNWHVTARRAEPGHEAAADHLAAVGPEIWTEFARTSKQHIGSAERLDAEDAYLCDWDGDGAEEQYSKATGGATATGRALNTSLEIENLNEDGLAQMVWFDRVGEETLLIRADNFGDEPMELTALCWTGAAWREVAHATLALDRKVARYRFTQGENIDFKTADWTWSWAGNAYGY